MDSDVLVGVGTGGHKTVSLPLLSNRYPNSPGRTLGLMDMIGQFGGVVGPTAVVAIGILGLDWRVLFLLSAGVIFLLAGVFFGQQYCGLWTDRSTVKTPSTDDRSDDPADGEQSYLILFASPRFTIFIVATVLIAFCWSGAIAFMLLFLTDFTRLSPNLANGLFGLLFAASLTQPLLGELSDRVGQLRVMTAAIISSSLAIAGLLVVRSPVSVGLCIVGFGVGMHGYRPVRDAYLTGLISDAIAGGTFGVIRTIMIVSGSISPFIVGLLIDFGSFAVAFAVLTALVFAATTLFIGLLVAS